MTEASSSYVYSALILANSIFGLGSIIRKTTAKAILMMIAPSSYVHSALILANTIFGLGSIIGALGLPATNPLAFTFVREVCSGSLLLLLSFLSQTRRRSTVNDNNDEETTTELLKLAPAGREDIQSFALIGFLLFLNQCGYIVGIQLAGPVTGSVWQPSAPIYTVAISMLWGLEGWSCQRVAGVLMGFVGCASMALLSDRGHDETHGGTTAFWIGNGMFLMNCTATALFILTTKHVLRIYPALTVAGWSYLVASVFTFAATLLSASVASVEKLICPACPETQGAFDIPRATLPALTYYIVFQSVVSWGLIIWANQYATGTLVVGYAVLQPVTSIVFTTLFLVARLVASCHQEGAPSPCLNEPGFGTFLGMLGVIGGLWLVVQSEPAPNKEADTPSEVQDQEVGPEDDVKEDAEETKNLITEYGTGILSTTATAPIPPIFPASTGCADKFSANHAISYKKGGEVLVV